MFRGLQDHSKVSKHIFKHGEEEQAMHKKGRDELTVSMNTKIINVFLSICHK